VERAPIRANTQEADFKIPLSNAVGVATIAGTATAVPPHVLTREMVKERIKDVFSLEGMRLEAIRSVIDNSQMTSGTACFPWTYIVEPRPLARIKCGVS